MTLSKFFSSFSIPSITQSKFYKHSDPGKLTKNRPHYPGSSVTAPPATAPKNTTKVQAFNDEEDDEDDGYQPGDQRLFHKSDTNSGETPEGLKKATVPQDATAEWLKQEANKLKSIGATKKAGHNSTIYQPPKPIQQNGKNTDMILSDFDIPMSRPI